MPSTPRALLAVLLLALAAPSALTQALTVQRLDTLPGIVPDENGHGAVITPDGEWVAFGSRATNLPGLHHPGGGVSNIYVRNLRTGTLEQANLSSSGGVLVPNFGLGSAFAERIALSADGRKLAFMCLDDDPGLGDANGRTDIYLRDLDAGTTELISLGTAGQVGSADCSSVSISADGRWVSFVGLGPGLHPGADGKNLFLRDRQAASTTILTRFKGLLFQDAFVTEAVLSSDGSTLAYTVTQPLPAPWLSTLNVYDIVTGTETSFGGLLGQGLSIDRTGTHVAFATLQNGVLVGEGDSAFDVFVLHTPTGRRELISRSTQGLNDGALHHNPSISPDGRYVAFSGSGQGLLEMPGLSGKHVFVHDRETGLLALGSINALGQPGAASVPAEAVLRNPASFSELGDRLVYQSNYENLAKPFLTPKSGIYLLERRTGGPQLTLANLQAGQTAQVEVEGASPGGAVLVAFSLRGQGPYPTPWGPIDLSPPFATAFYPTDAAGEVRAPVAVGPGLVGSPVFARGIDVPSSRLTSTFFGVIQ